jgi:hypothetical protein
MIYFSHFEVVEAILHIASFHILKTILYIARRIYIN